MPIRRTLFSAFVALFLLSLSYSASADPYSAVFVYGDSLSDNGNLYAVSGFPPAPYYNGRFSNGPVAVEQLAAQLGAPLQDFAWGGATTGIGNGGDGGSQTSFGIFGLPGMLTELATYPVPPALVPSSLFVVWGGANDFEAGGSVTNAIADINTIVAYLLASGATHILVPGLPNLGLTPEFYGDAAATAFSQQFNQGLQSTLPSSVVYSDVYGLLNSVIQNPGAYGLTDVTTPCFTGISVCSNPDQHLFWDQIHPTTAADAILASHFQSDLAPVPEPSSILLLGSGITGLAAFIRRRRVA
ncbi:MAG TPA: SGNH/GDSL hydrolase family protein [Edaphobacter sp.]|nr:SGNH/GDSL hydrolase family protein [Edaphobacter sp.]